MGIGIGFAIGNSQNETNSNAAGKARRPFKSAMHWGYPQRNSQSQIHNIEIVESIFLIIMIIQENFLTSCNKDKNLYECDERHCVIDWICLSDLDFLQLPSLIQYQSPLKSKKLQKFKASSIYN